MEIYMLDRRSQYSEIVYYQSNHNQLTNISQARTNNFRRKEAKKTSTEEGEPVKNTVIKVENSGTK